MIFRIAAILIFFSFACSFAQDEPDLEAWHMYLGGFEFENRIYQEDLLNQDGSIASLNHRLKYEKRFVDNQDFRTRLPYEL
ncbi:hypothetical protein [Marivirga sp.]|uniref:hypothetical protein n=1 Tax=Marivirga sp. TaxID=2018662 RepID=UPI002D80BA3E|nr:hypothetical protein [Marivirga sp.]HET8859946.1 hypothetical protein [Marivirga sp.]